MVLYIQTYSRATQLSLVLCTLFYFRHSYCTQGILLIADILGTMFDSPLKWVGHISALLLAATLIYWAISIASITRGSFTPYKNIGIWLNQNTQENAKIALVEIGTVGWYSDRPIIDILGLVNPLNARFIGERKLEEWLNHYSPDYILIHDPPWPHEVGAEKALAMGRFKLDIRFDFQGYKLLSQVSSEVRQP